jgi:hypothetical protein
MRSESTAQPFEAELDRYVESVVLSQAAALGDAAALAAWMDQEAVGWRKKRSHCPRLDAEAG